MPTNVLRNRQPRSSDKTRAPETAPASRFAVLVAGDNRIRLALADTPTAEAIWRALPLYSAVEPWGACIHFELPVQAGRDRTSRLNARKQEIYYWSEDDRVVVPWGATPISGTGEIRLMRPCNVWALALDDVACLAALTPGQKIGIERHSP